MVSASTSLARSGAWTGGGGMWVELSGKMHVLARLLGHLRQRTDDRIVLVSNYTQVIIFSSLLFFNSPYNFFLKAHLLI